MATNLSATKLEKIGTFSAVESISSPAAKTPQRVVNPSEQFEVERAFMSYETGPLGEAHMGKLFYDSLKNPDAARQFYAELLGAETYNHMPLAINVADTQAEVRAFVGEKATEAALTFFSVSVQAMKNGERALLFLGKKATEAVSEQVTGEPKSGHQTPEAAPDNKIDKDASTQAKIAQWRAMLAQIGNTQKQIEMQQHAEANAALAMDESAINAAVGLSADYEATNDAYRLMQKRQLAHARSVAQQTGLATTADTRKKKKELTMAEIQRNEASGAGGNERNSMALNAG